MTEITSSWDAVRTAYDRASQMAVQTVEAYAAIGDMLIELKEKDSTQHGDFLAQCARVFYPDEMANGNCHLNRARSRAGMYMRLATHRAAWLPHNPQSLNEAMKLLPKKETNSALQAPATEDSVKKDKRMSVGAQITKLAAAAGIDVFRHASGHEIKKQLHEALGVKTLSDLDMDDPQTFAKVTMCVSKAAGQPPEQVEQEFRKEATLLSQKDKRRIEKLEEMLRAMYVADVQRGVQEEYRRQQADLIAEMVSERDQYMKKHLEVADMKAQLYAAMNAILSESDYRFLLNVLHPDRAPADRRDKFARAFDIVRKLDPYIQAAKA